MIYPNFRANKKKHISNSFSRYKGIKVLSLFKFGPNSFLDAKRLFNSNFILFETLISNNTVYKLFLNSVKNRILELIMFTIVKLSTIYRVATNTYKITK